MFWKRKKTRVNYIDFLNEVLETGREEGYIMSKETPYIPELLAQSNDVCLKIIKGIAKENEGRSYSSQQLHLSLGWCIYAGIGSTYHWHIDWNSLKYKGLYETLIAERGIFAMDEYVLDAVGIEFESPQGKDLTTHIMDIAAKCICAILDKTNKNPSIEDLLEAHKAMFIYGMVIQMNRLGMR